MYPTLVQLRRAHANQRGDLYATHQAVDDELAGADPSRRTAAVREARAILLAEIRRDAAASRDDTPDISREPIGFASAKTADRDLAEDALPLAFCLHNRGAAQHGGTGLTCDITFEVYLYSNKCTRCASSIRAFTRGEDLVILATAN